MHAALTSPAHNRKRTSKRDGVSPTDPAAVIAPRALHCFSQKREGSRRRQVRPSWADRQSGGRGDAGQPLYGVPNVLIGAVRACGCCRPSKNLQTAGGGANRTKLQRARQREQHLCGATWIVRRAVAERRRDADIGLQAERRRRPKPAKCRRWGDSRHSRRRSRRADSRRDIEGWSSGRSAARRSPPGRYPADLGVAIATPEGEAAEIELLRGEQRSNAVWPAAASFSDHASASV